MQRQINTVESIPESFQINFGSNSFSSDMDQPFYESNMILNSEETPTLADYLLSPNDSSLDYLNMPPRGSDALNIWNTRDHNSSASFANQEIHDETKMDYGWNTALSINPGGGPRMSEEGCERTSILSLENVDLNLNNTPVDDATQSFTSSCQHVDRNACGGPRSEIVEVSMCPFIPEFFEPENVSLSNSNASSSGGVGQALEDNVRSRNSVDGRHLTCKRKNIDVIGESSSSQNTSADLSISSSSKYLPVASSLESNQSPDFIPLHRGVSSEWYPSSSFPRNAETSQRNCRVRPNPAPQYDISTSQSHSAASSSRLSSIWSPTEPSSVLNPFILSAEQNQPHIQPVPGLARHVHFSPSSSSGCSSSTVYAQRRLTTSPEESNIRNLPRNSSANHSTFLTRTTADHVVQDTPNWNPSNTSLSMSGNRASSSSCIIPLQGSIRLPSEMVPAQYTRNLSEVVLGTLFPSSGFESGHQSNNVSSRHSGRSASTQEPGQSSRAVRHGHSPPYPRSSVSIDRLRDGVSGLPLSARSIEGRSRLFSEHIRNALDLMRRGVNLRFEDVFIFDQSGFYGRADLYDRHRDMRLDVDNMSYEELLALEERIGYVNTGLSEDTILKCLRQRKYSLCKLVVASTEQEPCCICREDYHEGEVIGTLDCKHDFHAACIKQWLMIKNLCPICKTTAVVT